MKINAVMIMLFGFIGAGYTNEQTLTKEHTELTLEYNRSIETQLSYLSQFKSLMEEKNDLIKSLMEENKSLMEEKHDHDLEAKTRAAVGAMAQIANLQAEVRNAAVARIAAEARIAALEGDVRIASLEGEARAAQAQLVALKAEARAAEAQIAAFNTFAPQRRHILTISGGVIGALGGDIVFCNWISPKLKTYLCKKPNPKALRIKMNLARIGTDILFTGLGSAIGLLIACYMS